MDMRKSGDLIAGIDVGSTNIKCVVYDERCHVVSVGIAATSEARIEGEPVSYQSIDPDKLWKLVCKACSEAFKKVEGSYLLHGLAITSAGCLGIALDPEDEPIRFKISLKDLEASFSEWLENFSLEEFFGETGYPLDGTTYACYLYACAKYDSANFKKIHRILSIDDYIAFRLTGRMSREYSTACSMGLFSLSKNDWWDKCLNVIGIDKETLGYPIYSGQFIGEVGLEASKATGIPEHTKVFTGGHDYLCSAFATNIGANRMINVSGTIEILALLTDEPWVTKVDQRKRFIIDHYLFPNQYSLMMETMGLGNMEWFRRNIIKPILETHNHGSRLHNFDFIIDAMERFPRSLKRNREIFIPYIYGKSVPSTNNSVSGAFFFLDYNTTFESMMWSIVEGVAFECLRIYRILSSVCGREQTVVQVGGGSTRRSWVQVKANILGVPVFVPNIFESAAMGAALLAGMGSGIYGGLEDAVSTAQSLGGYVVEPEKGSSDFYHEIFAEIYCPIITELESKESIFRQKIERLWGS